MKRVFMMLLIACTMMVWTVGCGEQKGNSPPKKIADPNAFQKKADIQKDQSEEAPPPGQSF